MITTKKRNDFIVVNTSVILNKNLSPTDKLIYMYLCYMESCANISPDALKDILGIPYIDSAYINLSLELLALEGAIGYYIKPDGSFLITDVKI